MPTTDHSEAAKKSIISTEAFTSVVYGMYAFVNKAVSINWRASLVPAAAVIPASEAYINIAAVKKLVVCCQAWDACGKVRGSLFWDETRNCGLVITRSLFLLHSSECTKKALD